MTSRVAEQNGAKHLIVSFDDILAADDVEKEWVPIPEWAPKSASAEERQSYGVWVKSLNGRERAQWQQASVVGTGNKTTVNFLNTTIMLVVLAACDESGAPLFSEQQARTLAKKNSKILERIGDVASRLSGIGEEEIATVSGNSLTSLYDDSRTD